MVYILLLAFCSEREVLDADVEVITFDHITPSDLRKYKMSVLDPPQVKLKKERAERVVRREVQYWKVRVEILFPISSKSSFICIIPQTG